MASEFAESGWKFCVVQPLISNESSPNLIVFERGLDRGCFVETVAQQPETMQRFEHHQTSLEIDAMRNLQPV